MSIFNLRLSNAENDDETFTSSLRRKQRRESGPKMSEMLNNVCGNSQKQKNLKDADLHKLIICLTIKTHKKIYMKYFLFKTSVSKLFKNPFIQLQLHFAHYIRAPKLAAANGKDRNGLPLEKLG